MVRSNIAHLARWFHPTPVMLRFYYTSRLLLSRSWSRTWSGGGGKQEHGQGKYCGSARCIVQVTVHLTRIRPKFFRLFKKNIHDLDLIRLEFVLTKRIGATSPVQRRG